MTQKQYRRLTHFLFFFLFLVFFLLYLLLSRRYDHASATGGGTGWRDRRLALGTVTISDVRSGGFIVDEFPIPAPTTPEAEDFDRQVLVCRAKLYNEGETAINVSAGIYGTALGQKSDDDEGLCCAVYHDTGDDPVSPDYGAFLADGANGFQVSARSEKNLVLYEARSTYPLQFTMDPGETRYLTLIFWVDENVRPAVTDLDRDAYSVTVKLTSRGV